MRSLARCMAAAFAGVWLASAAVSGAAPVAVEVWLPGMMEVYREVMIRDFQREYPGIKLDLQCPEGRAMQEKLLQAVVTKDAPDLCLTDFRTMGGLYAAGICEPLDQYLADLRDLGSIHPSLLRLLSAQGKVQSLPVTAHPLALYIRRDWLDRLGLDAPATWSDFTLVAEAFTKRDPDGNGKNDTYGWAERWPGDDPEVALRFLPWLYQGGGLAVSNRGSGWAPGFGQSGGAKALLLWEKLWEGGTIPPSAPGNSREQNMALFTSGQAGMIVEDDTWVPAVRRTLGARAATVPLPRHIRMCTVGEGLCFVLLNTSNVKWEAFTFVQWWLSRQTQQRLILGWDGKLGGTGINEGVIVLSPREDIDPAALLGDSLYTGFVKSFPLLSPEPYCPNYAALRLIMAKSVAAAMGPETVEKALAAGMKEAAALLGS